MAKITITLEDHGDGMSVDVCADQAVAGMKNSHALHWANYLLSKIDEQAETKQVQEVEVA